MAAAQGATGDLKNNLMKVLREVQRMRLGVEPNVKGLCLGAPSSLLPLFHQALLHYSLPLASWLAGKGYELYGKNDLRFVEGVYKVLREVFGYKPCLTREQFLVVGYAERKLLMAAALLRACQSTHRELTRETRRTARRSRRGVGGGSDTTAERGAVSQVSSAETQSEVLTVHNTSGISSVWAESPDTREHHSVRAEDDCSLTYTPPHSPDHPSPPHTFTPTMACCHTHTAHLHSPPLPSSTPHSSHITASQTALPHSMVVCHSSLKSQGAPTISEATPEDDSKSIFLSSEPPGGQQFSGPPSLSSSSAEEMSLVGGEEGGGNVQRSGAVDGSGRTERGHSEQLLLQKLSHQMQQLSQTVEIMSGRLSLLETQLKTLRLERAETYREGQGGVRGGGGGDEGGGGGGDEGGGGVRGSGGGRGGGRGGNEVLEGIGEERRRDVRGSGGGLGGGGRGEVEGSEIGVRRGGGGWREGRGGEGRGEGRRGGGRQREEESVPTETISVSSRGGWRGETAGVRERLGTSLEGQGQQRHTHHPAAACSAVTMATAASSAEPARLASAVSSTVTSTPHTVTHHTITSTLHTITPTPCTITSSPYATPHTITSTPHTITSTPHTVTPHTITEPLSHPYPGSSLSAQLAALRAEPHPPAAHPPPSPSPHHTHTPPSDLRTSTIYMYSPSTPEDTRIMIASLRDRAQKTKDFLQKAKRRPEHSHIAS